MVKNIGKGKSVAVYTNIMFEGIAYYFACEFADNGSITVYPLSNFEQPITIDKNSFDKIDAILGLAMNPLIEQIKPFFEQSGLQIPLFKTVEADNVEVRDITYQMVYSIKKQINLKQYSGCLSSAFVVELSFE